MKNLIYLFIYVALLTIALSCTQEKIIDENSTFVVKGLESKDQYLALSPENQKQIWIARMKSYQNIGLSPTQKGLIEKMILDLQNLEIGEFYISEGLRAHAIAMAKVTPELDFISLFTDPIEKVSLLNSGNVCKACITDLENYVKPLPRNGNNDSNSKKEACNCRWTCGQMDVMGLCTSTSDCTVTVSGCGFLDLYECTGGCY